MTGELLVRPALNDHEVIADLLAPGGAAIMIGKQRPMISRLVVDAPVAARRPTLAEAAAGAGIPYAVDPLTFLLHGEKREEDSWAKLGLATHEAQAPTDFASHQARADFVARIVDFEIDHGATTIIPPYPYLTGPDDPWLPIALEWIRLTREHLDASGVALPIMPVFCGALSRFGPDRAWGGGLDRFVAVSGQSRADALAICLSPAGSGKDSYSKVWRLFETFDHVKVSSMLPVIAWRQGIFGPALVAAGIDGYETGIGISEQSNVRSNISSRRPPKPGDRPGRGGAAGIYLEPLGRSLSPRVARQLLEHGSLRAKVMCTDERCCREGVSSTLRRPREHAVRTRARELGTLAALPARSWRLNHVVTKTEEALTLARQANRFLETVDERTRVHTTGLESLARVAEELRQVDSERRVVA